MKVWIEWGKPPNVEIKPYPPNVFSSIENLLEYWKRTRFPADEVEESYERWRDRLTDELTCGFSQNQRWGKEVDLDDYFVKKAQKDLEEENNVPKKRKT